MIVACDHPTMKRKAEKAHLLSLILIRECRSCALCAERVLHEVDSERIQHGISNQPGRDGLIIRQLLEGHEPRGPVGTKLEKSII
jgi:hypothetical protein